MRVYARLRETSLNTKRHENSVHKGMGYNCIGLVKRITAMIHGNQNYTMSR